MSFAFAGDVFLHSQNIEAARVGSTGGFDFRPAFERVKPLIEEADFACCWLGGYFAADLPFRGYPRFRSPVQLLSALRDAGFDAVFATNHILDGGEQGLRERIAWLDSLGIRHPGEFATPEERQRVVVLEKNGVRVALCSYTYGTNGLPVPQAHMVSLIDTAAMRRDVAYAADSADFVIVALHQGDEYDARPSAAQIATARFLAGLGVDLVVSSHAHVVQPPDVVTVKAKDGTGHTMPVLTYGLGNFLCGQTYPGTRTGLVVRVVMEKDSAGTRLADCAYTPCYIFRSDSAGYRILPIERALLARSAGTDDLLREDEARLLLDEWRSVLGRVDDPAIPFKPVR